MPLAAALARDGGRPASFLPAIKCSSCGEEIEIASMGDHICGRAPPSAAAKPASMSNPFTLRQMNAHGHMPHAPSPLQQQSEPVSLAVPKTRIRAPTLTSSQIPAPKPVRPPPPRINPEAANTPFLAPRPPRSDSPLSPAPSARSAASSSGGSRPPPIRSATSPAPRLFDPRPPSPELSASFDCAFPPFPGPASAGSGSRPGTPSGRATPTLSDRAPSIVGSRDGVAKVPFAPKDPFPADPMSPMASGSENVMGRMETLKNGPFDTNRRKLGDQGSAAQSPFDKRRPSLSSIKFGNDLPPIPSEPIPRPSTSHSIHSQIPRSLTANGTWAPTDAMKKGPPPRPARPSEDLSPRFLDELSAEAVMDMPSNFSPSQPPVPMRSAERERLSPTRRDSEQDDVPHGLHKATSEPQLRGRDSRPKLGPESQSEPSQIPQAAGRARSQSRSAPRMDQRLQDAPPVPKPVQQYRQEMTHSPSHSGSSVASSTPSISHSHSSASGPSPVGSAASSVDMLSSLNAEQQPYGAEEAMRVEALKLNNIKNMKPGLRAEQPSTRVPPRNFTRPSPPKAVAIPAPSPTLPAAIPAPLESPMDPQLQAGRLGAETPEPLKRQNTTPELSSSVLTPGPGDYDPFRPVSPNPATRARSQSSAAPPGPLRPVSPHHAPPMPQSMDRPMPQGPPRPSNPGTSLQARSPQPVPTPPPVPQHAPRNPPLARRPTAGRATCRGCGLVIEGKSVKAADGRLTGRWHKACFVCRTCEQPFTTADFYVIANQPFCEQHYHEKNGSLCHGCNRGIEGQYLETSSSSRNGSVARKFHPRCFTCCECREVLSEDYFEITGKVYCERHALAAMRGQARVAGPGSTLGPDKRALTAERRTTRLMMM